MKIKTSEATNIQLDWLVETCEGREINIREGYLWIPTRSYSTDWAHGGPIIERERITTHAHSDGDWCGTVSGYDSEQSGPTVLIAAMRCYAASKMGDEVDIPGELI